MIIVGSVLLKKKNVSHDSIKQASMLIPTIPILWSEWVEHLYNFSNKHQHVSDYFYLMGYTLFLVYVCFANSRRFVQVLVVWHFLNTNFNFINWFTIQNEWCWRMVFDRIRSWRIHRIDSWFRYLSIYCHIYILTFNSRLGATGIQVEELYSLDPECFQNLK